MRNRRLVLAMATCGLAALAGCGDDAAGGGEADGAVGASDATDPESDATGGDADIPGSEPDAVEPTPDGGPDVNGPTDPTMAMIHGMIVIPPVHPRNIRHQTMKPAVHSHVEYFQGTTDAPTFEEAPLPVTDPKNLRFHRLFRGVDVVPIPPPEDSTEDFTFEGKKGPIQTDQWSYHTKVQPDGSFQIQVAPYKYGYYVSAAADRVRLKQRVLGDVAAGDSVQADLTIRGTLIANYALSLDEQVARTRTNADIDDEFAAGLVKAVNMTKARFKERLTVSDWYALAKLGDLPPVNAFVTGGPGGNSALDPGLPFCNLRSGDEITALGAHSSFDFGNAGALDNPLKMLGFTIVPQTSATITDDGGRITLDVPDGEYVELLFMPPVRSVGMEIQNGTDPANASDAARRPFEFEAFDRQEGLIAAYRWYTNQEDDQAGFYGITSSLPIRRVRLSMTGGGSYTIDDLAFAAAAVTALNGDLGWRATGDWTRKAVADDGIPNTGGQYPGVAGDFTTDFDHEHRSNYGPTGDAQPDPACTADNYWSGGTYWVAGYGDGTVATTSALSSPAFTIGNLITDVDDAYIDPEIASDEEPVASGRVFDYWMSGDRADLGGTVSLPSGSKLTDCELDDSTASSNAFSSMGFEEPTIDWDGDAEGPATTPGSATMRWHWSHVHWQSYADIESDAVAKAGTNTDRRVEYSMDNGATWRRAWWFQDDQHRGPNGQWWSAHMHPFPDSDLVVSQYGGTCTGTDFNKDGAQDYNLDIDGDGDGYEDGDDDDCRQWDTDWYYEYVEPPYECIDDEYCTPDTPDVDGVPCKLGNCLEESFPIQGMSVVYRFVFETQGNLDASTCFTSDCVGWAIDDVAFNSDDEDVGYFTNFDEVIDPNAQ